MAQNEDFMETGELAKELGLKETLTIGIGTMIGAGIFVLPRFAIGDAGPAAVAAYIFAGLLCMITAASTAELATGMPKSGGAYFFVSRSMGPIMGTISGVTVWLSLTFAVAFYLSGFGEYLAYLLPIDSLLFIPLNTTTLALLAGAFFTYINYIGAKETGKTQNIIVAILLIILGIYFGWGLFHVDVSNLDPFFVNGLKPILPVTALIFISFLGFVQIASVAEEVKDPSYTLPRSLIGSVAIVTIIYVFVLLVTSGILPYQAIVNTETPLVDAAKIFSGVIGGLVITFAALLATASSANASILASSRISFALGRDNVLPEWFNKVHPKFLTPSNPIIITGIVAVVLILSADVALLSDTASVLMLINYSFINLAVIILRKFPPEGYQAKYRAPGFPYLQIVAAVVSFGVIFAAGTVSKIIAFLLISFSLIWFGLWVKNKTSIKGALSGVGLYKIITAKVPDSVYERSEVIESNIGQETHEYESESDYRVLLPMANPEHEKSMLKLSSSLAKGNSLDGIIDMINILKVPSQTPLDLGEYRKKTFPEKQLIYQKMLNLALEYAKEKQVIINPKIIYSRSRRRTIYNITKENDIDFLLLGWHDPMNIVNIYSSLVKELVRKVPCPVGVFRDKGLEKIDRILVPFRGSEHAYWGIDLAKKIISDKEDSKITVLRIVKENVDAEEEKEKALEEISELVNEKIEIKVVFASKIVDGILNESINNNYDLIIMGASKEWSLKNMLFGSIPDIIAEKSLVSVLMLRYYDKKIDREIQEKVLLDEKEDNDEPLKI